MKRIASIAAVAVALSACTTLDNALQNAVPATCRLGNSLYAGFVVTASTGKIPEKAVAKAEAAYKTLASICADPSSVKTENLPVIIAQAYANFVNATTEAKNASR